jgi:uncharacterized protein (TIGR02246 family)
MKEAVVREILKEYFNAAMNEPDVEVFVRLFTPDGVLEDPVGTPPHQGREAIRQLLIGGKSKVERGEVDIREIFSCGSESAVHWKMQLSTKRGEHVSIEGIGIFMFDEQGKIRHVKEYYDAANLPASLA